MEDKRKTNILCSPKLITIKCSAFHKICVCILITIIYSTIGFKPGLRTIRKTPKYPLRIFGGVGIDGFRLFMESDMDWDDRVSMTEFKYILKHLKKIPKNWEFFQDIKKEDEFVTLKAKFKQRNLLVNTNSEEQKQQEKVLGITDHFEGLHGWQKPQKHWFNFAVRRFHQFLPPSSTTSIGKIYEIIKPQQHRIVMNLSKITELEARRIFRPLDVEDKYSSIHHMLSMFHQNPFISKRGPPYGGYGVVRARNEKMIEIVFRIAVEFQLNDPETLPFWLTPEPLKGSLVINRDYTHLVHFRMYLETDREIHIGNDLRMVGGQQYQITGEHIKEMSLESTSSSVSASGTNAKKRLADRTANTRNIEWTEQITRKEAFEIIDEKMKIVKKDMIAFEKNNFIPMPENMHQHMYQGNRPQAIDERGFH